MQVTRRVYLVCYFREGYKGPHHFWRLALWSHQEPGIDQHLPPRYYFLGPEVSAGNPLRTASEHWHTNPYDAFWYATSAAARAEATLRACKPSCGFVGLMEATLVYDHDRPDRKVREFLDSLKGQNR